MNTISTVKQRKFKKNLINDLREGFLAGTASMPTGTIVKLNTGNGKLEAVAAATDVPFGVLEVGSSAVDDHVTVKTQFSAIARAKAGGSALTKGDRLAAQSLDGTSGLMVYAAAAATHYTVAVALEDASANAELYVGILKVFVIDAES